jgi:hypothetical protein
MSRYGMFIRCTTTRSKQSGDTYQTYRLVENERIQDQVKQRFIEPGSPL